VVDEISSTNNPDPLKQNNDLSTEGVSPLSSSLQVTSGFKEYCQLWFGDSISDAQVKQFEQNILQTVSASYKEAQTQHKRVEAWIKEQINDY
tara:strand:- start:188 stop:463 length:276 start_codon:yes stop_codon:yes gene_type:complete